MNNEVIYVLYSGSIQELEGRMLTFLEAIIHDPEQRKSSKDLLRPMIWEWAIRSNYADGMEIKRKIDGQIISNEVSGSGTAKPKSPKK